MKWREEILSSKSDRQILEFSEKTMDQQKKTKTKTFVFFHSSIFGYKYFRSLSIFDYNKKSWPKYLILNLDKVSFISES